MKKVCVLGLGYIGLPTSAVLANRGVSVLGVDICERTVDGINAGMTRMIEPDLDAIVRIAVEDGFLKTSMKCEPADVFIIAVQTPFKNDREPDLSYIRSAANMIAPVIKEGDLVVLESTSPVGTTEKVSDWLQAERPDLHFPTRTSKGADVFISHCPERVMPGKILQEIISNSRIIGGITSDCAVKAKELYSLFVEGDCVLTDSRTAELAKLAENAFRDTNIAYANELSMLCNKLNIDVWHLIELANHHPRVNILQPGPGVGGHCIAVDPWFMVHSAPEITPLIRTAREVNLRKTDHVVSQIEDLISATKNPIVAYLGLSYKANVDDLRESPAVDIVSRMANTAVCPQYVVEPNITKVPKELECMQLVTLAQASEKANIIVLLVDHREFESLTLRDLRGKSLLDTRGLYAKQQKALSASSFHDVVDEING